VGFTEVFSILYVFCFMRVGIYFFILCGWGRGRKYAILGIYRSTSQTISYEISIIFFVLIFVYITLSFDFSLFLVFQTSYWFCFINGLVSIGWGAVCLAEANRTPFDFSEGESELVSGFNIEYRGGVFSLIFICEYGNIIFLRFLRNSVLFGGRGFYWKSLLICTIFVWVRGRFPRTRYDLLIIISWKVALPLVMCYLLLILRVFSPYVS